MAVLHVDFLGKRLAGPVVAASGTFGFGPEYADIEDLRLLLTAYRMGLIRQADRAEPLGGRCGIDQLF